MSQACQINNLSAVAEPSISMLGLKSSTTITPAPDYRPEMGSGAGGGKGARYVFYPSSISQIDPQR
ncbi:hypothetical protein J2X69_002141 [Algoriphagus sp. 4150]|nr:hypothetical protein [Algoriphagus sp. 4150]